jgi:type IV pilus assembly protein PilM
VFLLSRKYRQLLGLDITTSSIKLIELAMSAGQYRVESYAAEPTPANAMNEKSIVDPEAIGEAIRRAVKRSGAKATEVAIAISGDAAITKVIQMPRGLRESDLESQVEMQADQYIPFPMDEVSYDFEVLGNSEKDGESVDVLLVASRTENVEQRRSAVSAAGLTARIVDVEAFALENACRLMTHQMPDGGIDHSVAVVDFGASNTTFSVLRNLKVVYTRDFAFGGQQLTEEIMRTYGLSMEEAGRCEERGRPARQLSGRSARSFHRRHDATGQSFAAVLSGLGQRPRTAGSNPDLRRLRQYPGRGRCRAKSCRHQRRTWRSAGTDEAVFPRARPGRAA